MTRDLPVMDYIGRMLQRIVAFGIPIASLAGASRLLRSQMRTSSLAVDTANDMNELVRGSFAIQAAIVGVVGMLFVFLHLEINRTFYCLLPPVRMPMLTVLWVAMCYFLLCNYLARPSELLRAVMVLFGIGLLAKIAFFDLPSWHLVADGVRYMDSYTLLSASMRMLDFGFALVFLILAFRRLRTNDESAYLGCLAGVAALVLFFIVSSLELNSFLWCYMPQFRAGGISILWSLFAIGMLLGGVWNNLKLLRYAALTLFAVVIWKVFFSDLVHLDQLYRIVAFLILGIMVLSGSFIYLKYRQTFITKPTKSEDSET